MAQITTMLWDVGGVLLSNGWDTAARRRGAEQFNLNWDAFQERHALISAELERGRLTLDGYLEGAIFYEPRDFSKEIFRNFIFAQSQPKKGVLSLAKTLAVSGNYQMTTLNNESRELNLYRIERFNLRTCFSAFFSSCFLGVKKPEKGIYQAALDITQRRAEECLYIDDRAKHLETANRLRMNTIHFKDLVQLREELRSYGVEVPED